MLYEPARILDFAFFCLYPSAFTLHRQRPRFAPLPGRKALGIRVNLTQQSYERRVQGHNLPRPRLMVPAGIIVMRAKANRSVLKTRGVTDQWAHISSKDKRENLPFVLHPGGIGFGAVFGGGSQGSIHPGFELRSSLNCDARCAHTRH
jgi:hypothetical protein